VRLYSKATGSTYLKGMHADIPDDAIEISEELYRSVIGNASLGKIRSHDENGLPYLADIPPVEPDPSAIEREWRDAELASVMWLRERHRDQQEIGADATLESEQFKELLVYTQALRDWPQSPNFPNIEYRPVTPTWIGDHTQ
jgi:hypothetical protein